MISRETFRLSIWETAELAVEGLSTSRPAISEEASRHFSIMEASLLW